MIVIGLSILLMLGAQDPTLGQPSRVDDVEVRGARLESALRRVEALTEPRRVGQVQGQLARWREPICVRVMGPAPESRALFALQIAEAAAALGAPVAASRCRPNAVVVVTDDPDRFARAVVRQHRVRFFDNRAAAIQAFMETTAPVRWSRRVEAQDGGESEARSNPAAGPGKLIDSRLQLGTSEVITNAVAVVDARRASTVAPEGLARYLALVITTDLPMDHRPADDSILALFDRPQDPPPDFSRWDGAFVRGLYAISPDRPFGVQRRQLAHHMLSTLSEFEPDDQED